MVMHCPPIHSSVILPLSCNDKRVWMGMGGMWRSGRWWALSKVRVAVGPAVMWFYQESAWSVMQSGESGSSWPLPHSPDCSEGPARESWFWFAAHPHSGAALNGPNLGGETLCFPLCLYHFPARSLILCGYLLQPTVLFSLPPSPPSFRQLQVCVHSTEEMCWLAYKGPGIKMDQEILVPLYTESLPSHGSKCHSPTPWPTHSFGKKGDEKLLPHCCCHLPAARWNIPSQ